MSDEAAQQLRDDKRLASRVARGEKKAFDVFFDTYFPRLYRFALARTGGNHTAAEEVAQSTLCNVMFKLDSFRGEASLFTWLCQICRHELAGLYRKAANDPARHVPLEDSAPIRAALESLSGGLENPETARGEADIKRLVRVVLDYLPPNYGTALEMKYIEGASVADIAAHMGITVKAAESLMSRARSAFRDGFKTLWDGGDTTSPNTGSQWIPL